MSDTRSLIKDTLTRLTSLRKVFRHVSELKEEVLLKEQLVEDLGKTLDKELKDFEQLQRLSVKGLFYKALGSKEEQIEKERQEYLKANLVYQAEVEALDLLRYESEILIKKSLEIEPLEEQLKQLFELRSSEILRQGDDEARRLRELYERLDGLDVFYQEIKEAHGVCQLALNGGQGVISHLDNALRWGQWDMSSRRGSMYEYQKRSAIDRAITQANQLQMTLTRLGRELDDVGLNTEEWQIDLNLKQGFMSVFFDNLISDWIVQQRIASSKSNVQRLLGRLSSLLQTLNVEMSTVAKERDQLDSQRKTILSA